MGVSVLPYIKIYHKAIQNKTMYYGTEIDSSFNRKRETRNKPTYVHRNTIHARSHFFQSVKKKRILSKSHLYS